MSDLYQAKPRIVPWIQGKLTRQELPLKQKEVWAIRIRLWTDDRERDLALFRR